MKHSEFHKIRGCITLSVIHPLCYSIVFSCYQYNIPFKEKLITSIEASASAVFVIKFLEIIFSNIIVFYPFLNIVFC